MYGCVRLGLESVLVDVVHPDRASAATRASKVEKCIFICAYRSACPNGASASSPRLARQRLPWVNIHKLPTATRLRQIRFAFGARVTLATTALRLRNLL